MKVLILLFFIIVPFSFQSIQAAFFCEDVLPSVFLIDQSTGGKTYLDKGRSTEWTTANIFTNLQAEQGDKIEINCDSNYGDGSTCGGGCFLINNICQCYDFSVKSDYFQIVERSTSLGGKQCYLPLKRFDFDGGIYTYTYRIPLDARGVTCPSVVLIFRYGKNYDINFLKYITTNFVPKNLEISITDKYKYFELNGVKLDSNNRFNIDNNLIFNSIDSGKISVKFRNFGIILPNKDCELNIRVCNQRCLDCNDLDSTINNHQCKECDKDKGYYKVEDNEYNCYKIAEMIGSNYYFDADEQIFKRCYKSCAICNAKSLENINNCTKCADLYHFIYNDLKKGTCVHENEQPNNTYLDPDTNIYELCYERCSRCNQKNDIVNNNCEECAKDDNGNYLYHFLQNENGKCITENEKPLNTYLDLNDNTYKFCYERCSLCNEGGDESNNNCKECSKDDKNNYLYHFLHDEKGKCINETERPLNTYLDLETNTYELCYQKCSSCDKGGDISNNNCKECLKVNNNYVYHFIYDKEGKCVNELERPLNSYLDLETNTYRLCYERCSLCNIKGDESNNNCDECTKDVNNTYLYHFVYNETGRCLNESEKPSDTYLDLEDNTYKKCYERCSSCDKKGDGTNNNCNECLKDNNNTYLYHFIFNETGRCLNESEKPSNTYLDEETNTYRLCYERCSSCDKKGDETNNNCNECLRDVEHNFLYHFVYNETGRCLNDDEKPSDTYLDLEDNTYKKCYERCSSCDKKGDEINNNCNECLKDNNNNYIYHFIYDKEGKCISDDDERPSNTYLDKENNIYKLCYIRCSKCDSYPECKECVKDESNNYIYHLIYDQKGKCIDESEIKDGYYYLDNNDNTYKICPEGTIRVENNECIEKNEDKIILAFIIIIIILILVAGFFIARMLFKKQKEQKDLKELIIN